MFQKLFPEADPFRRNFWAGLGGDSRRGSFVREKAGKGNMFREVTEEGISVAYEEDGWTIGIVQTEDRISLSIGRMMSVTYDRDSGAITAFEISALAAVIMAAKTKVETALPYAEEAWEWVQEKQDIRLVADFMEDTPAKVTFFRTNINNEAVEISSGGIFRDVGEGVYPKVVYQAWSGQIPWVDLTMRILVEEPGISVVIQDEERGWVVPVAGYFCQMITSRVSSAELIHLVHEAFPTEDYSQ